MTPSNFWVSGSYINISFPDMFREPRTVFSEHKSLREWIKVERLSGMHSDELHWFEDVDFATNIGVYTTLSFFKYRQHKGFLKNI